MAQEELLRNNRKTNKKAELNRGIKILRQLSHLCHKDPSLSVPPHGRIGFVGTIDIIYIYQSSMRDQGYS